MTMMKSKLSVLESEPNVFKALIFMYFFKEENGK